MIFLIKKSFLLILYELTIIGFIKIVLIDIIYVVCLKQMS